MAATRRQVAFGLAALALGGCRTTTAAPAPGRPPAERAQPNAGFDTWLAGFRNRAAAQNIDAATLDAALSRAGYLPGVLERDRNQTEHVRTLEDYLAIAAGEDKVETGRQMLQRHRALLARIEARYGVEARVIAAIWGVESRYGTRRGDIPVVSALATLGYASRRAAFFERELVAALRILQRGDVRPGDMTGSWAGAMGHTQFIPSSYLAYAVDFDGDGRRDIWADDPTDALASTANYLARAGWQHGRPWGVEVRPPQDFDTRGTGRGASRPVAEWAARGVRTAAGGALPDHGAAALILPQGVGAPAFLAYRNFTVISRYNNATAYVIAVGYLSDRLAGGGPLRGRFPPDAAGLSQADRIELQQRLTAQGFDTEGSDGVIGDKTRAAIAAWQKARGLPATGEASLELLRLLRGTA